MLAFVNFKLAAQPSALPVRIFVAEIVEERAAAKIHIPDEHSAKMADVADAVAASRCQPEVKF